jgi:hypothetical protein
MATHCWYTSVTGPKKFFPRYERVFLSIKPPVPAKKPISLKVKGLVQKIWCNGVLLKKQGNGYPIPPNAQKPWENEFLIRGIPVSAWLEGNEEFKVCHNMTGSMVQDPLEAAGHALVSFVVNQGPGRGDIFSFYDPVSNTYRMPEWRWDSGICLEALAKMAQLGNDEIYKIAVNTVVDRFLKVQIDNPDCKGGFPEIADLHMAPKAAVLPQWVVPFNGAFIGAGLLSAMDVVDEPKKDLCIKAAYRAYDLMVSKAMNPVGFLRGYYHQRSGLWQYHGQINDSGIFPRVASLLRKTGCEIDTEPMELYSRAMASFIQPDGFVGRGRWLPGKQNCPQGTPLFPEWKTRPDQIPGKIFSRGQAWYLLGAAGTWQLTGSTAVAQTIRQVMEYLLSHQDRTGFWHHDLGQPGQGLDVKGSSVVVWALMEARPAFEAANGDMQLLGSSISRAWDALLLNQKDNLSGPLPGGLKDAGKEGAIIYFRNRPMYTAYGIAAFILSGLSIKEVQ